MLRLDPSKSDRHVSSDGVENIFLEKLKHNDLMNFRYSELTNPQAIQLRVAVLPAPSYPAPKRKRMIFKVAVTIVSRALKTLKARSAQPASWRTTHEE